MFRTVTAATDRANWGMCVLRASDLEFDLPPERIATHAVEPRDSAKMLVVSRSDPLLVEHARVSDLPQYMRSGDALIVNSSRVIPARFTGVRRDTGGQVDGLYIGPAEPAAGVANMDTPAGAPWRVMMKAKRLRDGVWVDLHDRSGGMGSAAAGVSLRLVQRAQSEGEEGAWIVAPDGSGLRPGDTAVSVLERIGAAPLPPYIRSARKRDTGVDAETGDRARYQTVYARADQEGSIAAPTAGLHFTPALLEQIGAQGVEQAEVVLHVGTGTFKPVEVEHVEEHPMHSEWCEAPGAALELVRRTRSRAGRVFAVGTTAARTLESMSDSELAAGSTVAKWTRILITPGTLIRNFDGLLTNFHLPRSTLLAMVAAVLDERSGAGHGDGVVRLKAYYQTAINEGYRFYSFGDAMLVLP